MIRSRPYTGMVGRLRSSSRRNAWLACAGTFITATALYVASPYMTLWNLASAVENNDMIRLGKFISWRSLCENLQKQTPTMLANAYGLHTTNEDSADLPDFGSSFATKAVSNAIQFRVNQDNLGTLVGQFFQLKDHKPTKSTAAEEHLHGHAHFLSPTVFTADVELPGHKNETPLEITLQLQGWHWKITQIHLPTPIQKNVPIMEAAATGIHG